MERRKIKPSKGLTSIREYATILNIFDKNVFKIVNATMIKYEEKYKIILFPRYVIQTYKYI